MNRVETLADRPEGTVPDSAIPFTHLVALDEIIAGSLQRQGRASLVGVPTFGKDTIQLVFDLADGSSLRVTAARWWVPGLSTPLGEHGLQPDSYVKLEASEVDMVLQIGLQELLSN